MISRGAGPVDLRQPAAQVASDQAVMPCSTQNFIRVRA